jgi:hypothetical protein
MLKNFAFVAVLAVASMLGAADAFAATQQTSIFLRIRSILQLGGDLQTAKSDFSYDRTIDLASGTGADQGNQVWSDTRTLTTGATETLDLNGSLVNAVGESVTFTKVKVIFVRNKCTTTLSLFAAAATQLRGARGIGDRRDEGAARRPPAAHRT